MRTDTKKAETIQEHFNVVALMCVRVFCLALLYLFFSVCAKEDKCENCSQMKGRIDVHCCDSFAGVYSSSIAKHVEMIFDTYSSHEQRTVTIAITLFCLQTHTYTHICCVSRA